MMRHILRMLFLVVLMLTLPGAAFCINHASPGSGAVELQFGERQTFKVAKRSRFAGIEWFLDGRRVSVGNSYTFSARHVFAAKRHTLTAREHFWFIPRDTVQWAIHVLPSGGKKKAYYRDRDRDGYGDPDTRSSRRRRGYVKNGSDCNDSERNIHPGVTEIQCDGIDQDCDGSDSCATPQQSYYRDADGDGFGNPEVSVATPQAGYVSDKTDCNDNDTAIHPGVAETCNGVDDNCSGAADEGVQATFYRDADSDGFGSSQATQACSAPAGYVANATDCNDSTAGEHPGAAEVECDGIDQDCSGADTCTIPQQTYYRDADGDGYGNSAVSVQDQQAGYVLNNTDCNDDNVAVHPGATEACNGVDDDCDSSTDEGVQLTFYRDADSDGYGISGQTTQACSVPAGFVAGSTDCNDADAAIHPGATEIECDTIDQDCSGADTCSTAYYRDEDGDGFGNPEISVTGLQAGYVLDNTDCNDADVAVHPGAAETCNGVDDNCSGVTDEGVQATFYRDVDSDGYGSAAQSIQACSAPGGYVADSTDCNDALAAVHPGAAENCTNDIDDNCDGASNEGCASVDPDQLAQNGLNLLIDHLQAYMASGGTPTSIEDILPLAVMDDIRTNYFQAALNADSGNPSAHFGLAVMALVNIAYDVDSVAIIDLLLNMLTGADSGGASDMGGMAAMLFGILDSSAADYLSSALEHMNDAVNLDTDIVLQLHMPVMVTDANGNPVPDPETGRPQFLKDANGHVVFETEKSNYQLDRTDMVLIRGVVNLGLGALHLYKAYDLNIADANGSYDYFGEIVFKDPVTGTMDLPTFNGLLEALEYNDKRSGFLTMLPGGQAEAQASQAYFLAAIADIIAALDNLVAETDDQTDDLITIERMESIYASIVNVFANFAPDATIPPFSIAYAQQWLNNAAQAVNSTASSRFDLSFPLLDAGTIDMSLNLSGVFTGSVTNLHQYLPYHYWFYLDQTTAYPPNAATTLRNLADNNVGMLYGLTIPFPLYTDDWTPVPTEVELDGWPYLLGPRTVTFGNGLIQHTTVDLSIADFSFAITAFFPDMTFGGIVQGLTQAEVDAVMNTLMSSLMGG